jgi:hypothetical protein
MPVAAVVAEDHIFIVESGKNADRVRLLPDVGMRCADQVSLAELLQQSLFEAPDQEHDRVEAVQAVHKCRL